MTSMLALDTCTYIRYLSWNILFCLFGFWADLVLFQGVPLLYVPLEVIMSKYYGESERLLGTVFSLANEMATGAIVFLDEVLGIAPLH